ncbi:sulfite exporter TauE/SafE family protein [Paracoccus sp. 1_MG-2023]|uniref:sulfite exporter TauE/SafE family protein n=1 Tax=Paracoccus sp. 1_MG-2023 TaxID=3062651 RepID=UPI001C08AB14|nr:MULTISPECIES: sulfite exporter TauE/SafE family protein [unclassified Paracoccus (in: a-proteobacteria)]MBU2958533.1 sulfite exporter TauE/SafE family protein [Paracoccus sp. C2R09]MDO6668482.1 sulfite exporter TauE/SafE family protein [Paracoccus sp. 1_MG-2023]
MDLGTGGWILAVIAASAVGLAKGGLSMVGIISVPLLSLVMSPIQAAGVMLPVYVVSDIGGLIAFRGSFDTEVLKKALPGAIGGIAFGWATSSIVPVWGVTLIVGLIGLCFALNALLRPQLDAQPQRPRLSKGTFWGGLAGYTSFLSHSGAPLWQVYAQPLRMPPLIFAGTSTWFFAIGNWIKLLPYAMLGQLSAPNLGTAAVLMPASLVAVWVGLRIVRIIPQALFYKLITWGLLLISLRLIWQGLA